MPFGPILGMVLMTVMASTASITKWVVLAVIGVVMAAACCFLIKEGRFSIQRKVVTKLPIGERLSHIYFILCYGTIM